MFLRAFLLLIMVGALGSIAYVTMRNGPVSAIAAPAPVTYETSVLVAARALTAGTLIRESDVRWERWALSGVPEGYFMRGRGQEEAYMGSVARRSFAPGEPIIAGQLVAPGERGFLAAVLTPGMRAVSVAVDVVSAASGLIWPGDRVDVILTQTFRNNGNEQDARKVAGETVLRDIRVLAIDQHLGEATEEQAGHAATERQGPRTVTLEVSPRQGEMVRVAANLGSLALSLRSIGVADEANPKSQDAGLTWASDVSSALHHDVVRPPSGGVEVVRGSKRETALSAKP